MIRRQRPLHPLLFARWLLLALLAFTLSGCDASPTSRQQGTLERAFKDPKARQLAIAAERNDATEVRRLMKEEHVNPDVFFSEKGDGFPLLAWPILTDSPEGLRAMLENGADPNVHQTFKTSKGKVRQYANAMVYATRNENPAYLKLLLEHGGNPDTRNGNDENLMYLAFLWHNQWQNVQLLIEHGADINAGVLGEGGQTILFYYSMWADFDKVYWLLEHGAKPTVTIRFIPPPSAPRTSARSIRSRCRHLLVPR